MQIYTYRLGVYEPPWVDLTNFDVEALDGHIGKVDETTYDEAASCLVVDTGFWIFGKKRMLPAGLVQRIDVDNKKVYVAMMKGQVKGAPDFEPDRHRDHEAEYHRDAADYYEAYFSPLL